MLKASLSAVRTLPTVSIGPNGTEKHLDGMPHCRGRCNELKAGPVDDRVLLDVAQLGMDDKNVEGAAL